MWATLTRFWASAGASNILFVIGIFVLLLGWNRTANKADEYAENTRKVIVLNNEAGLDAVRNKHEDTVEIIKFKEFLNDNEIDKEYLDTPIPLAIVDQL